MAEDIARAIEAIVMVAEEPVPPNLLAQLLEVPIATVEAECAALVEAYDNEGRGFILVASRAATGSRAIPISRPTSNASCSRASRLGFRPRRSRRWRSSPTSSRSRGRRSRRSAASNVEAVVRTLQLRGYIEPSRPRSRPGPGGAVGDDPVVPREARPRYASTTFRLSASSSRAPTSSRRWRRRCGLRAPIEPATSA